MNTLHSQLLTNIKPLTRDDPDEAKLINLINQAIKNTHAHQNFSVTLHTVFALEKPSESLTYRPFERKLHNKFLLWAGCKQTSLVATLRHGLKMPSIDQAEVGLMFGKGIYLTDCFSKAANSCQVQVVSSFDQNRFGIVFLVEAALGQMHLAYQPDQFKHGPPIYCHSVYGVG